MDQTYNEFVKHNKMVTNVSSTKDLQNKTRKNEHQPIIVTSIQKLDRIKEEHKDILDKKRIVLIFDEAFIAVLLDKWWAKSKIPLIKKL
ncbi:DEAD/DEAH box helicase family protein [Mycoplasmopsis cynos]|uniref:DEAD/DEAH box helicase family protein n=1 Tax=Mycoplasmopsis cynos TaxID=171284 RepID=UPI0024C86D2F|nr:DEAD/DEAH box helicase family protein [Mycoplasmopsis cynos]WAM04137.1 DEAD/DEAH box helicase family protein [Mycoplasmopsis cynos]